VSIRVRIAANAREIDAVFRLRHRVFAEEGYMDARPDGRIFDQFDAYPGTANIVAVVADTVIGAVRYMQPTDAGCSVEEFFDPRPLAPPGARLAVGSLLVVDPAYRGLPRITFNLTAMGFYWAASQGLTHIVGVVNPEREEGFARSGFRRLGPVIHSDRIHRTPVQPMIADLESLTDRFASFLRRHSAPHWLQAFEREFHGAGEVVMRAGKPGSAAYVVISGRATEHDTRGRAIGRLGPGDLFGELAPLINCPSTSTVTAQSDLELMVLERATLRAQLRENPAAAEDMTELLANRLLLSLRGNDAAGSPDKDRAPSRQTAKLHAVAPSPR
jgi:N-acyl-L-homoserine lactone synthetase